MSIEIDETGWPFTLHTVRQGIQVPDMESYLLRLDALLSRKQQFVTMFDATDLANTDRRVASIHGQWIKERREELAEYWVGLALVLNSPAARFIFSSLLLMTRLPMPYQTFTTLSEGARWLKSQLAANDMPVPARLEQLG